jgi:hypothetical protein
MSISAYHLRLSWEECGVGSLSISLRLHISPKVSHCQIYFRVRWRLILIPKVWQNLIVDQSPVDTSRPSLYGHWSKLTMDGLLNWSCCHFLTTQFIHPWNIAH